MGAVTDREAFERRFRRAGLPLFIEDRDAHEDVWTRASPLLTLVFVGELLGAIQLDWPVLANVAAAAGGLAILVGAFGLVNLVRGRRFWSLPDDVGNLELAAFVIVPAALPAIFGGQLASALVTAAANLALLAVVYAVIGYGLAAIVRWAAQRLFGQLGAAVSVISRAVPLLLVFALVLFINTEMWQVFSGMPDLFLALVCGLFVGVGSAFLVTRLPREVRELEDAGGGPELSRRARLNVALVLFVSQALQILTVAIATGVFFAVFGALAVPSPVREAWEVTEGGTLVTLHLAGERIDVTAALLRVSGGIAAFAGAYYAIAVLTDATYRREFLDELTDEMRGTFAARAEYVRLLESR
jgi:hypothetical protein